MNLLFFTEIFHPFGGGGEYIFFLIARELVKKGYSVHVITQRLRGTSSIEVMEGIKIYRVGEDFEFTGILPSTIRHRLAYIIHATKKGSEIIKENKKKAKGINIIHSNTYMPALSGQMCSVIYNIPHLITVHDVMQASDGKFWKIWAAKQKANVPFYAPIVSKLVERITLKLPVAAIHAVSQATKEDILKFGVSSKKITVIPNGVELSTYRFENHITSPTIRNDQVPIAVFIGRLVFYKNITTIVQAFKKVVKSIPNARLMILGEGPDRDILINEASSIKNNVIFKGRVSDCEKIKLINTSSHILFPSLIEGFGMVVIEGFACSKPVLVSDVRPLSDIVKDGYTGYVIPPFDVDKWAEKIITLFNDHALQEEIGKNAYNEFLGKYEIKEVASKIEILYKTMVHKKKTRLGSKLTLVQRHNRSNDSNLA